jgi:transitional endoplasmic reticulum ATPase
VNITDLIQPFFGSAEKILHHLFTLAKSARPCILFFDEMQSMVGSRGTSNQGERDEESNEWGESYGNKEIVSQLILEIDALTPTDNVIIIAATNLPWALDVQLLQSSRLGRAIHIPLPSHRERADILSLALSGIPVDQDVNVNEIADKTIRYSGADLKNLVRLAGLEAVKRLQSDNKTNELLTCVDFHLALQKSVATVSLNTIQQIKRWEDHFQKTNSNLDDSHFKFMS